MFVELIRERQALNLNNQKGIYKQGNCTACNQIAYLNHVLLFASLFIYNNCICGFTPWHQRIENILMTITKVFPLSFLLMEQ